MAVFLTSGSALLLFLSGLFSLLTPLPFVFLFCRRGGKAAVLAAGFGLIALALVYRLPLGWLEFFPGFAFYPSLDLAKVRALVLLTFLGYAWLGLALPWVGKRRFGWEKGIFLAVASCVMLTALIVGYLEIASSGRLLTEFRASLQSVIGRVVELNPQFSSAERPGLAGLVGVALWRLFPALWISMITFTGALNLLFARRWLPGTLCAPWGDFSEWRLREPFIWFPLTAGCGYFASRYLMQSEPLSWIALNLVLIAATIYFFQGASVGLYLLKKYVSPLMRLAGWFVFFFFFQVVAVLLVLVGLFDFWFDFRKLKK